MDPLGSLQVCVYYVKQMNAFPALTTKSMSAPTGTGTMDGTVSSTASPRSAQNWAQLSKCRTRAKSANQLLLVAKVSLFLSRSRKSLFNQHISLQMLEQSSGLGVTPETNTLGMFWPWKCLQPQRSFGSATTSNLWFLCPKTILSCSTVSKLLQHHLKRFQPKLQLWKPVLASSLTIFF